MTELATPPEGAPDRPTLITELSRLPPGERAARFRLLHKDVAARAFDALDPPQQRELLEALRGDSVRELFESMDPDDRVRLLDEMPAGVATRLLAGLSPAERELTSVLLGYPPESAGRVMSPETADLRPDMRVDDALAHVRAVADTAETLYVLPVRNASRHLLGVVGLSDLLRADDRASVASIMRADHPSVSATDDQEVVARLIQEENLLAVPVVDRERRLVGIVTVDDAMEVIEREETEDLARAGGSEPLRAPYFSVPVWRLVRARIVWLLFLVAAATLTVSVLGAFEATLDEVVTLALFVPLLIGTGGNCGAQAATTITRALAVGDVRFGDLAVTLLKEARVGLLLGATFAAVGFPLVAAVFSASMAAVISLTLVLLCVWATTVGAALPLFASRLGIDPAVVSAPLVTTLVDATGLVIYLSIAGVILL
ncbi:MAG: magnesium transporter [Miltoncostaeaceae bacterium]